VKRATTGCAILLTVALGVYWAASYRPGAVEIRDNFERGFSPLWSWEKPHQDAARILPDPLRPGNLVAGFFLKRDDALVHGAKRVEMALGCVGMGEAYRYQFEAYLPGDYAPEAAADNIAQWHDMPDFLLGETWRSPSLKFIIRDGRWALSHRWSSAKVNRFVWEREARDTHEEIDLGRVEKGRWVRWEFRVLWAWDDHGRLQVLSEGHTIYRKQAPTAYRDWRGPYFKIGMYKPDWSANPDLSRVQERHIYYDNVEVERIKPVDVFIDK
jgi:Polysaccharide lyase